MRLVAGRFRGRTLTSPLGEDAVRPTSNRTREAVFNVLTHRFQGASFSLTGAHVLDVFAGTGAMGLEALSRGAAYVVFMERETQALAALRANIKALKVEAETCVAIIDAAHPPPAPAPVSLSFLDPPYAQANLIPQALAGLEAQGWFAPQALCVCETARDADVQLPDGFTVEDCRVYGKAKVLFVRRIGLSFQFRGLGAGCPQKT